MLTGLALAVCGGGIVYVLGRQRGRLWLIALALLPAVPVALLASATPGFTWDHTHDLATWVVAGMASGVAASRGPAWGLVVFITGVAVELAVEQARSGPASALVFLGAFTYYVGAAVTHVLARRGFATTEQALEAVAAAETAQRVAEERWLARREADRLLHDTVLATLSLLAHRERGLTPRAPGGLPPRSRHSQTGPPGNRPLGHHPAGGRQRPGRLGAPKVAGGGRPTRGRDT